MSELFHDKILYIQENIYSYIEYINTNINKYNIELHNFSKSKFYCDFLFYLNNKKRFQPKIDNLDKNIKIFLDLENDENIMSFKSVFFITNKLQHFFNKKDYFFNYFFFTKNLYDTFLLYSFNKVSNLSEIKNIKNLLNDNELFEKIKYYDNIINKINDILIKEEYSKIKIFDDISSLSLEYNNINIVDKEIIIEIVNNFTDYEITDSKIYDKDFNDIEFLNKVYNEIYESVDIKKYFERKEIYNNKKNEYKQKEYIFNLKLCLQQLEHKNLSDLEKSIESINEKIVKDKKQKKILEFEISNQIRNNNNKMNILEKENNNSIDKKQKNIDELDDNICTIEEIINEIKKNKNTRLLENDFNIVKKKSVNYPDNEQYKKKLEFIRNEIKNILSSNSFEIKIQNNRLSTANKEKDKLMIEISKMIVNTINLKQITLEENKKLNTENNDNIINSLDIEKKELESQIINKKIYMEKIKKDNYECNKIYNNFYREFIKFNTDFKKEIDNLFLKYQFAIQNIEKFKIYISRMTYKQQTKGLLDYKMSKCLNKDFFSKHEADFTKRCDELYNSISENIDDNNEDLKYVINLISGHHIYNFYSYLIVNMCRILPEIYSNNIKIIINNKINNIIENNIIENNYNLNLEHSNAIINEYKNDKMVEINNDNIYKLEVIFKKKNKVYEYLNNIQKIKDEVTIMDIM